MLRAINQSIGIDFGTYNSAAGIVVADGSTAMVMNSQGRDIQRADVFPSFVKYDAAGEQVLAVGQEAKNELAINPAQVIWDVKSLLGRGFDEVPTDRLLYQVISEKGAPVIRIGQNSLTPVQVTADILRWIKEDAENPGVNQHRNGQPITGVVIAHPAYFRSSQIEALKKAASSVFNCDPKLITEPEAAALAYGLELDPEDAERVMVIDWGAGTLDIVICRLRKGRDGVPQIMAADPARGDVNLGGNDIDTALLDAAIDMYGLGELRTTQQAILCGEHEQVDREFREAFADWRTQLEEVKVQLSRRPAFDTMALYGSETVHVWGAQNRGNVPQGVGSCLVLDEILGLREATVEWDAKAYQEKRPEDRAILERFRAHIDFAFSRIGYQATDIDYLILTGGPMWMPCARQVLRSVFADNRSVIKQIEAIEEEGFPVNPMEAVARGAASCAAIGQVPGAVRVQEGMDQPAFDYGIYYYDSWQGVVGDILIRKGGGLPASGTSEDIRYVGSPGQGQRCGLYLREETPDSASGERFLRLDEYVFAPYYDPELAAVDFTLKFDADGIASIEINDRQTEDHPFTLEDVANANCTEFSQPTAASKLNDYQMIQQVADQQFNGDVGKAVAAVQEDLIRRKERPKDVEQERAQRLRTLALALDQHIQGAIGQMNGTARQAYDRLRRELAAFPAGAVVPQGTYRRLFEAASSVAHIAKQQDCLTDEAYTDIVNRLRSI